MFADLGEGSGIAACHGADEFFGLFLILFERGMVGKGAVGHTKLLSGAPQEVRMWEAERRFAEL
jgi:hypothetical protein